MKTLSNIMSSTAKRRIMQEMIKAENLWFGYSDEKEKALQGVNFTAE